MTSPNFSCISAPLFFVTTNEKSCTWSTHLYYFFVQDMRKKPRRSHQLSQRLPLEVLKSVTGQSNLRLRWSFFPPHHSPVLYIDHTFGIWITKVRGVWWTIMHHCFIYGICCLVWENACWKARNTLLYLSHEKQNKTQSLIISYKTVKILEGCDRKHFFFLRYVKKWRWLCSIIARKLNSYLRRPGIRLSCFGSEYKMVEHFTRFKRKK